MINIFRGYGLTSIINPNSSVTVIQCGFDDDCYIECSLPNQCEEKEIILENSDPNYNVTIKCDAEYACSNTFIHGIVTNLYFYINATEGLRYSDIWLMFPTNYTDSVFYIESQAYQGVNYVDFHLYSEDASKILDPLHQSSFIPSGVIYINPMNSQSLKDCYWHLQSAKYVTINFTEFAEAASIYPTYRNNFYFPVALSANNSYVGSVHCQPWSTNNLACGGINRIFSALGMNAVQCVGDTYDCWDLYLYCGWHYEYYCGSPYSSYCTNECSNDVAFYSNIINGTFVQFSYIGNEIDLFSLSYWNNKNVLLYVAALFRTNNYRYSWFDDNQYLNTTLRQFICPSNSNCDIYCLSFYSCKEIALNASNSNLLQIDGVEYVNEYFTMANAVIYASPKKNNIIKIGAEKTAFHSVDLQFYGMNSQEINIQHCEFCGNSSWFLMDSDLINFNCDPSITAGTDLPCIYTYFFIANASVMNLNCVSPDGCRSSKIFTDAGVNAVHYDHWQTLNISCRTSDSSSCQDLEIIYPDQSGCTYIYNATNGDWYCQAFFAPSMNPTVYPTIYPTIIPTNIPTTNSPTAIPTSFPSKYPSFGPSYFPAKYPTLYPTLGVPSKAPSIRYSNTMQTKSHVEIGGGGVNGVNMMHILIPIVLIVIV